MKVLIAEDHALFREALGNLIKQVDSSVTIIEASKYSEIFSILAQDESFDFIILDLDLPDEHWEEGLFKLREKAPHTRIAVVSASEDCRSMRKSVEAGIVGYIPKSLDPKVLFGAIKIILDGGTYVPINAVSCQQENSSKNSPRDTTSAGRDLTKRQTEVLMLVAEGKSNKQIAFEMGVSEATVKLHINALLRSLGASNRTKAVILAQKKGLI